jgi:hypothetical protein
LLLHLPWFPQVSFKTHPAVQKKKKRRKGRKRGGSSPLRFPAGHFAFMQKLTTRNSLVPPSLGPKKEISGDMHFLRADMKRPESQLSGSYLMST